MTDEEFEKIFELQNSNEMSLLANELIKPVLDKYAGWLVDEMLKVVDRYKIIPNYIKHEGYNYRLTQSFSTKYIFQHEKIKFTIVIKKSSEGVYMNVTRDLWSIKDFSDEHSFYITQKLPNEVGNMKDFIENHLTKRRRRLFSIIKSLLIYCCYDKFK